MRGAAHQRKELERLCRYITRPAIANERLSRNAKGQVVLQRKSPYREGTTHIVMEKMVMHSFLRRLMHVCLWPIGLVPGRGPTLPADGR
ncbi:MAG: hypothetical protein GEV05_23535 [Betaproteobacteria bacterium]|nr:hypothetical protein [Betaproteobacteria bacterium]